MTTLEEALAIELTEASFDRYLRQAISQYYRGVTDETGFFNAMLDAVDRAFEQAWTEGARECGIEPGDRTTSEEGVRVQQINSMIPFIEKLTRTIDTSLQHKKADEIAVAAGGKPLYGYKSDTKEHYLDVRASMLWANRYGEVRNLAKTMACQDQKLVWRLGPTKEHCITCSTLAGKVKRASYWRESYGILPRSRHLECKGFHCECELEPTDLPSSRGPLPHF